MKLYLKHPFRGVFILAQFWRKTGVFLAQHNEKKGVLFVLCLKINCIFVLLVD